MSKLKTFGDIDEHPPHSYHSHPLHQSAFTCKGFHHVDVIASSVAPSLVSGVLQGMSPSTLTLQATVI